MNVANSGVAMFGKGISQENIQLSFCVSENGIFQENIQLSFCMSSKGIFQETYSFQRNISRNLKSAFFLHVCKRNISRNVQLSKEYFKKRTAFKGIFQET